MARGINKVIIVGSLGNDPEQKSLQNGSAVTNISVATSEQWKDKNTGQKQERTEWHRVVFFNRLAEIAGQYLRKGAKVYLEGSLRTRKWTDQQGNDKYSTEIIATELQMLGDSGHQQKAPQKQYQQNGQHEQQPAAQQRQAPQYGQAQPQQQQQTITPQGYSQPANFDNFDDDIPF